MTKHKKINNKTTVTIKSHKQKDKINFTSKNGTRAGRQEILNDFDKRINKKLEKLNSFSESDRSTAFNQWLGGIMDSDGCFYLNKKNVLSCEISLAPREIEALHKIEEVFGGRIGIDRRQNYVRLRIRKRESLKKF